MYDYIQFCVCVCVCVCVHARVHMHAQTVNPVRGCLDTKQIVGALKH